LHPERVAAETAPIAGVGAFFATFRCIYGVGARKYWLNMVLERY
jgi:hypothetical protein